MSDFEFAKDRFIDARHRLMHQIESDRLHGWKHEDAMLMKSHDALLGMLITSYCTTLSNLLDYPRYTFSLEGKISFGQGKDV